MIFLDKLNLRPQERRLVVLVTVIIFIVLNLLFVRPHFGEWGTTESKITKVKGELATYQKEIASIPEYQRRLKTLQSSGSDVLTQELEFQRVVQGHAKSHGLNVNHYIPRSTDSYSLTNKFFGEQMLTIDFRNDGKELVDFLVDVAAGNSMIRVRQMDIKLDQSQTKLMGNITLVASYQKQAATNKTSVAVAKKK